VNFENSQKSRFRRGRARLAESSRLLRKCCKRKESSLRRNDRGIKWLAEGNESAKRNFPFLPQTTSRHPQKVNWISSDQLNTPANPTKPFGRFPLALSHLQLNQLDVSSNNRLNSLKRPCQTRRRVRDYSCELIVLYTPLLGTLEPLLTRFSSSDSPISRNSNGATERSLGAR